MANLFYLKINDNAPLVRWLHGKAVTFHKNYRPHNFYQQVRALLMGIGVRPADVDHAIVAAVFELRKWPATAHTAQEQLRLLARRYVGGAFGGELPIYHGIEGVSLQTEGGMISAWLEEMPIVFGYGHQPHQLYGQITALLLHAGVERQTVEHAIIAAVFEQQKWNQRADTAAERLRLLVRTEIARRFGGKVPEKGHGIAGIPLMPPSTPLSRWVAGAEIKTLYRGLSPQGMYQQIRALGLGLKIPVGVLDPAMVEAIYEKHDWIADPHTPEAHLRDLARWHVAHTFGGQLSNDHGIAGVGYQDHRAPLTRWLDGRAVAPSDHLWSQVRALLLHGGLETTVIDRLMETIFKTV